VLAFLWQTDIILPLYFLQGHPMTQSNTIAIKPFDFIHIKSNDNNIDEIMLFCGVSKDNLKQERIYHDEGDDFCYQGYNSVATIIGDYLIKAPDGTITHASGVLMDLFFKLDDTKSSTPAKPICEKCSSDLDIAGFCEDETCMYSDYLQDTTFDDLGHSIKFHTKPRMRIPANLLHLGNEYPFDATNYFVEQLQKGGLGCTLNGLQNTVEYNDPECINIARYFIDTHTVHHGLSDLTPKILHPASVVWEEAELFAWVQQHASAGITPNERKSIQTWLKDYNEFNNLENDFDKNVLSAISQHRGLQEVIRNANSTNPNKPWEMEEISDVIFDHLYIKIETRDDKFKKQLLAMFN
jgi:hypothetical protein